MPSTKTLSALAGLLFLLSANPLQAQFQDLDQTLPRLMDKANVPGLSIAVMDGGRVAYSNAFGVRSADGITPLSDQTVFAAASLSKPLFAFGVLQIVEEGKFDLDKPLADYLEYEDLKHDPRRRRITARMVLSHTSGLPNWRSGGRLDFVSDPGERFRYSGEGFVFLQKAMERVTGQTLEDFMQQRVFKPLGMSRSSYVWQASFENDFAIPHDGLGATQGKFKPTEPNAAHSLQTTAPDYARFVIALLNGIGIRKASIDQTLASQAKVPVETSQPEALSATVSWGLGWGLQQTEDGGKAFWHWGDNGTFRCFVLAFPEKKSGLVFFTNSQNGLSFAEDLVKEVFKTSCPACNWMDYPRHDEPAFRLPREILDKGLDAALAPYLDAGGRHQNTAAISEGEMNSLGYQLLRMKRLDDAKRVFRMNLAAFPASSNVYDSFGEACLRNGEVEMARENYQKAADLDPSNDTARRILEQLLGRSRGNTTFTLTEYSNARLVTVAGDFNGWSDLSHPFRRRDGEWTCTVDLPPGKHNYKFVVDGVWIPDPANPAVTSDLHHNSIVEVKSVVRSNTLATPGAGVSAAAAAASPARDVLSRYAEAMGGKAKWKEFKTGILTMRSPESSGAGGVTFTATLKKPNKYRLDFINGSNRMVKSYNGTKGVVSINYRTQDMGAGEQHEMAEEVDFFDELLFAEEKGYATELLGTEQLDDDRKVFKIKLAKSKDDEQFYYLDEATHLPAVIAEYSQDESFKGVLFKTVLSDWREVDGLQFPFKMTLLANNKTMWTREVESVKVNPKVEDKVFEVK